MKYNFFNFLPKNMGYFLLLLTNLVVWSSSITAREIYFQPSINVLTEYDDNKRLKSDQFDNIDTSAFGVIANANAKVGVRSDRYGVELDNQVSIRRYISDFDLDSDDFNINLSSHYYLSARSTFGLNGNYTRNTTLTSELEDGLGTGLVQENITRRQWSITPHWNYTLSQTQNLQASYSHTETAYDESDRGSFVDYKVDFFSLSFKHQWTPLFSNTLSASVMLYEVPELSTGLFIRVPEGVSEILRSRNTTEYTVNVGVEYQMMPTWFAAAQVGVRFTNIESTEYVRAIFEQAIPDNDLQGLVFSVSTRKEFESGFLKAGFSRSTSAQGDGRLQVQDSFTVNYNHELTERLSFSISGSINGSSTSGDEDDGRDRTNYRIGPSIRWSIDKRASLSAGYTYRKQIFESNDREAVSNAVFFSLNYQWDKFATQRY